jgi:hypothetical protein
MLSRCCKRGKFCHRHTFMSASPSPRPQRQSADDPKLGTAKLGLSAVGRPIVFLRLGRIVRIAAGLSFMRIRVFAFDASGLKAIFAVINHHPPSLFRVLLRPRTLTHLDVVRWDILTSVVSTIGIRQSRRLGCRLINAAFCQFLEQILL